jgi:hypothetical protein
MVYDFLLLSLKTRWLVLCFKSSLKVLSKDYPP